VAWCATVARKLVFQGGTIVTLGPHGILARADLWVEDGIIVAVGKTPKGYDDSEAEHVDCSRALVLPGFVQAHVHLCQALFRGLAEEADLLQWLERKIWPLEAAHTPESLAASAWLGLVEAVRSGTTTICDMGTVRHAEVLAETVRKSGIRAVVSKLLMDQGSGVPAALIEPAIEGLAGARRLIDGFHGSEGGRLRVALAPRFVLSCSRALLEAVAAESREHGLLVHTHLNESRGEIAATEKALGRGAVAHFDELGLLSERLVAAHGVWFHRDELEILAQRQSRIVHCPSANLKLASGICDVRSLRDAGVGVALGADGLPCNNRSDPFQEMRLAGLLSRLLRADRALSGEEVVRLATIDGARALGMDSEIGSLEPGKRADIVVMDATGSSGALLPRTDVYDALVYQMTSERVRAVAVEGRFLFREGRVLFADEETVLADAAREREALVVRAGLGAAR
jgi:5-methylthioadenosine/S-adenosylhomocysteine deaminase